MHKSLVEVVEIDNGFAKKNKNKNKLSKLKVMSPKVRNKCIQKLQKYGGSK